MAFRPECIAALERLSLGDFHPDLTLLFDVPVEVGRERLADGRPLDKFERQQPGFFERVRTTYLTRAAAEPSRFASSTAPGRRPTCGPNWPRSSPPCERIDCSPSAAAQALLPWHRDLATAMLQQRSRWPQALADRRQARPGQARARLAFCARTAVRSPAPRRRCVRRLSELPVRGCRRASGFAADRAGDRPTTKATSPPSTRSPSIAFASSSHFTQLSTHRHRAKVAVIAPAEAMNAAAANALLKTLEEPPAETYLMLVSHQTARLAATIISRCRRLPVAEPDVGIGGGVASGARRRRRRPGAGAGRRGASAGARAWRIRVLQREGDQLAGRAGAARAAVAGRGRRPLGGSCRRTSASRCLPPRCTGC